MVFCFYKVAARLIRILAAAPVAGLIVIVPGGAVHRRRAPLAIGARLSALLRCTVQRITRTHLPPFCVRWNNVLVLSLLNINTQPWCIVTHMQCPCAYVNGQRIVAAANRLGCMAQVALSAFCYTKDRTNAAGPQEVYDVLCHLGFEGGGGGGCWWFSSKRHNPAFSIWSEMSQAMPCRNVPCRGSGGHAEKMLLLFLSGGCALFPKGDSIESQSPPKTQCAPTERPERPPSSEKCSLHMALQCRQCVMCTADGIRVQPVLACTAKPPFLPPPPLHSNCPCIVNGGGVREPSFCFFVAEGSATRLLHM